MSKKKGAGINVDSIIDKLLSVRGKRPGHQVNLEEREIYFLCDNAQKIFMEQPVLLELEAPLKVCGDVHGQYYDLLRLFEYGQFPPDANYLFLGDYINRGDHSIQVISLLLCMKISMPNYIHLLRGNHECKTMTEVFNFRKEICELYD